jgi:hypothetical protein
MPRKWGSQFFYVLNEANPQAPLRTNPQIEVTNPFSVNGNLPNPTGWGHNLERFSTSANVLLSPPGKRIKTEPNRNIKVSTQTMGPERYPQTRRSSSPATNGSGREDSTTTLTNPQVKLLRSNVSQRQPEASEAVVVNEEPAPRANPTSPTITSLPSTRAHVIKVEEETNFASSNTAISAHTASTSGVTTTNLAFLIPDSSTPRVEHRKRAVKRERSPTPTIPEIPTHVPITSRVELYQPLPGNCLKNALNWPHNRKAWAADKSIALRRLGLKITRTFFRCARSCSLFLTEPDSYGTQR